MQFLSVIIFSINSAKEFPQPVSFQPPSDRHVSRLSVCCYGRVIFYKNENRQCVLVGSWLIGFKSLLKDFLFAYQEASAISPKIFD